MGQMRDSDWSREILLRSDWSGPSVAIYTTVLLSVTALLQNFTHRTLASDCVLN